jgi:hypothetical protein
MVAAVEELGLVRKTPVVSHFCSISNDQLTKTGSGQPQGNAEKEAFFI